MCNNLQMISPSNYEDTAEIRRLKMDAEIDAYMGRDDPSVIGDLMIKLRKLETKNNQLKDDVAFFKNQTRELRNHKDEMFWKIESFRQMEATWRGDKRRAEEHAAQLEKRVESLLSMEDTWLGDKRKAETYALVLEEQENISWAESQIIIGKLKEELKNKDGKLDAMRTLNDSMEDMLSQTKKKLEETQKGVWAGQAV